MKVIVSAVFYCVMLMQYASGALIPAMEVIAGDGNPGASGNGGPGTSAELNAPYGVWVDSNGNAYFTLNNEQTVRSVSATGIITKIMGTGTFGWDGVGGAGTAFPLYLPYGITGDTAGGIYVSDRFHIWKYSTATKQATRFAGQSSPCTLPDPSCPAGDGGPATSAGFGELTAIHLAVDGSLYLVDIGFPTVRKITTSVPNIISLVAGNGVEGFDGDGGPALSTVVMLNRPNAVYVTRGGAIFFTDQNQVANARVRVVDTAGIISTFAGGGSETTDGIYATSHQLGSLGGLAYDENSDTLYITAYTDAKVYQVDGNGIISTFMGSGPAVDPPATLGITFLSSGLNSPYGIYVTVDSVNSLPVVYLTEFRANVVKKMVYLDAPTSQPTSPTFVPSFKPSELPSGQPSCIPSSKPSVDPTGAPTINPTDKPSLIPSSEPSVVPTVVPTINPTDKPSIIPSSKPSVVPTITPTINPTGDPTLRPVSNPSGQPSGRPSSKPTAPSFVPTKAPNVNDVIIISGGLVVSEVSEGVLNNRSMTILTAAVHNISGSAQDVTITTTKLIKKKGRTILDSVSIYSFQIDFVAVYYLSYYSGWNTSYVAEMKLKTMKAAVEDGSFEIELRRLAAIHNATQLFNATCHEVTLSASEITSTSSSSTSDNTSLSDGEIAGIVIASVFGMCLALCLVVCFLYRRDRPFKKVAVVAYEANDCDKLDERM
jgi:hypothetical protein